MFAGKAGAYAPSKTDAEIRSEAVEDLKAEIVKVAMEKINEERHIKALSTHNRYFLMRYYLILCNIAEKIVLNSYFNSYIFFCIILAGILVGAQTYPALETFVVFVYCNHIILASFILEVVLKLMSEGTDIHRYFTGEEYHWNIFDFLIVLFSLPIINTGGQVAFLRLIRLMRLGKIFKKVPQLRMIINGLFGGMKSIAYIVILLFLVFYLFAITGILAFQRNDPWHFRSVSISLTTLFQIATLTNWSDIFYINYYGCDLYDGGMYTNDPTLEDPKFGGVMYCSNPTAQPALSMAFFISFIFICSFTMLSLFIGTIIESMNESMELMKHERNEEGKKKVLKQAQKYFQDILHDQSKQTKRTRRKLSLLTLAFEGGDLHEVVEDYSSFSYFVRKYKELSEVADKVAVHPYFVNLITLVIIVAGVQVGVSTDAVLSVEYASLLATSDIVIRSIFTLECLVKIVAEEFSPWVYFDNNWNVFDIIVVMGSYVNGGGSLIVMLRLLRLLRVLKLMRSFPQLQVIVSALMAGMSSIGFISIIMTIFFYFFAIIAMIFFGVNDPAQFGLLHLAMLKLFQACTLDDWSSMMFTNMYGCDVIGYEDNPQDCTNPTPNFVFALIFFLSFVLFGSLILLTLFIGVVATGMEQATTDQNEAKDIEQEVQLIQEREKLTSFEVNLYKEVYNIIDLHNGNVIEQDELRLGLDLCGRADITEEQFLKMWKKVDIDGSGGIDFSEFLTFMLSLRRHTKAGQRTLSHFASVVTVDLEAKVKEKSPESSMGFLSVEESIQEIEVEDEEIFESVSEELALKRSARPGSAANIINRQFSIQSEISDKKLSQKRSHSGNYDSPTGSDLYASPHRSKSTRFSDETSQVSHSSVNQSEDIVEEMVDVSSIPSPMIRSKSLKSIQKGESTKSGSARGILFLEEENKSAEELMQITPKITSKLSDRTPTVSTSIFPGRSAKVAPYKPLRKVAASEDFSAPAALQTNDDRDVRTPDSYADRYHRVYSKNMSSTPQRYLPGGSPEFFEPNNDGNDFFDNRRSQEMRPRPKKVVVSKGVYI